MDDTISRQAAIEAICKQCPIVGDYHKCDGYPETSTWCDELVALRALPTAGPDIARTIATILENEQDMRVIKRNAEPRWIPVVDKLPNEDEIVYNSIGIEGERDVSDRVLAIDSTGFVRCGYFMKSCSKHEYHGNGKRNKYSDYGKASWAFGEHYESKPKNWIVAVAADIVAWMPVPLKGENDEKSV